MPEIAPEIARALAQAKMITISGSGDAGGPDDQPNFAGNSDDAGRAIGLQRRRAGNGERAGSQRFGG